MRSSLRRTVLLLAGLTLLGAACADGGSPTDAAPSSEEARVGFSLDVAGTSVSTIAVEVTAPDITSRLVFNIEALDGVATGSITIPAGADRTITARAFDARGVLTHQGSKVVTVKGGENASITITMVPVAGEQPLTLNFGALIVQVSRAVAPPTYPPYNGEEIGDTVRYKAAIRNADGSAVTGKVRWASLHPAIATVDSLGLVTVRRPGQAEIVATYQGAGGSATVTVRGDGTDGTADQTAPRITALAFADSINIAAGDTVLNITVSASDAGSGVRYAYVYLSAPAVPGTERDYQTRYCSTYDSGAATPGNTVSWACRIKFSPHNVAGTWTVGSIQVYDQANNYRSLTAAQLAASGIKHTLKVANANADVTPPTVTSISIAPDSINLTTATDTAVTVTVTASDPGAGVESLDISFSTPNGSYGPYCSMGSYSLPSGTATNQVTWNCRVLLRRASAAGTYTISSLVIRDRVGNARPLVPAQITAAGWESTFKAAK